MHAIQFLDGKVVSVTTAGFITDIKDLESKLVDNHLFSVFKQIRFEIAKKDTGLELKNRGLGIIS